MPDTANATLGAIDRAIIGALAGLAAISAKFLGQDIHFFSQWYYSPAAQDIINYNSLKLLYFLMGPILIFLGALVCWATDESNRLKLIALGVAAPAMITTFAGGPKPDQHSGAGKAGWYLDISPISSAFAQGDTKDCAPGASLTQGAKLFFGVGAPQKYWVIVGSYKNKQTAEELAKAINAENSAMKAFVGKPKPCNEFHPVIVGDYLPYADAQKLKQQVDQLKSVHESYLSAYEDRR